jgi:hypothetical protein
MPSIIGGFQVAKGTQFLHNCSFTIHKHGTYLIIFNASSSVPGNMEVTYYLCRNMDRIPGATSQCASGITCQQPFIFPSNISIIQHLHKCDVIDVKIMIVSGIESDSIYIVNTILTIQQI